MSKFQKAPFVKKYYILHPFQWIGHYWREIKFAWQRMMKGYSDRDTWDIDHWFLETMPNILEDFNKNRHGYPSDVSDEQWEKILNDMIKYFKNADEETTDFINKYSEQWDKMITTKWIKWEKTEDGLYKFFNEPGTPEEDDISKKHSEEEMKKFEYMKENLHKGLELFEKYFYALWD